MRALLTTCVLLLLAAPASSQIYAVHFKTDKLAEKYKKYLHTIDGRQVIVCEAKEGVRFEPDTRTIRFQNPTGDFDVYVADPSDPSSVPYRVEGEEKVVSNRRGVVTIQVPHVERLSILIEAQSLHGLAVEYVQRKTWLDEARAKRAKETAGTKEWFIAHRQVMTQYERLQSWLARTAFPEAAEALGKEIEREEKTVAKAAFESRARKARESIHKAETPPGLLAATKSITNDTIEFRVQESLHVRIVYMSTMGDERVRALLDVAEQAIEGFRNDCVDPYLDEEFEDKIPERLFCEFWFGPEDIKMHERFYVDYYGRSWGTDENKNKRLEMAGSRDRRTLPPEYLQYTRSLPDMDYEGMVGHSLGHALAALHYNLNRADSFQDWLEEAVGYYISLEFFGRNTVTCKEFQGPVTYAHEKRAEGEKSLQLGLRDFYNALALDEGPSIDQLALKKLYDMTDPDLAKSWSFYDYLVRKEGRAGQLFLRAACELSRTKATFIKDWRARSEVLFEVRGKDVFKEIEKRWSDFAEIGQNTGDTRRAR